MLNTYIVTRTNNSRQTVVYIFKGIIEAGVLFFKK